MRLVSLILACTLLPAIAACAQNTSPLPAAGQQSHLPAWNGPSVANRGLCYSIVTIHARRSERLTVNQPLPNLGVTTCTPANRFRAQYIPNATLHRQAVPAVCPECSVVPGEGSTAEVKSVNVPR